MKIKNFLKLLPGVLIFTLCVTDLKAQAQPKNSRPTTIAAARTPRSGVEYPYDKYMRLGYAASNQKDYRAALEYFKKALQQRPNDRYATLAYWNVVDYLKPDEAKRNTRISQFDRYMNVGYAAAKQGDYHTALINFRRAKNLRPSNAYASQAIRNMQTFIDSRKGLV